MKVFIVGATGATGKFVVQQVLEAGHGVKAVVRSPEKLKDLEEAYTAFTQIKGNVLDMEQEELKNHLEQCEAVVCCLGHNISFQGMYGKPRKLVRDSVKKIVHGIEQLAPEKSFKFVLMNTNGNANRDLNETYPLKERIILNLLYLLLPPHTDNIQAAEYLRTTVGKNNSNVEWAVVRPDTLIDEQEVTEYEIDSLSKDGAIFSENRASRINVANFMTQLVLDDTLWEQWKGSLPYIKNK